jgi:hypothetical protein
MADEVNGIPTAHGFQKKIGRTGLRGKFKMSDTNIDNVLKLVQNLGYWRGSDNELALRELRAVRKACIDWIMANMGAQRASRPHIEGLCAAVHKRYLAVLDANFGLSKETQQITTAKSGMAAVHDEIRMLRAKKEGAGKSLDHHYAVERGTAKHLPANAGTGARGAYDKAVMAGETKLGFEDWVSRVLLPCREDDPMDLFFKSGVAGGLINDLKKDGVKYCNPRERDAYLLGINAGIVKDASDAPYHTGSKQTAFSGMGWAIYVVDFDGNFYAESHVVNKFHHSSFLAGAPVLAGGEIAVDQGRIVAITNKTGHYKAGAAELKKALELLQRKGVNLANVKVNDPFKAKDQWVTGTAALVANGDVAVAASSGTVGAPAKVVT